MQQNFDLNQTIDILERTPCILDSFLEGISKEWSEYQKEQGTWSAKEVVAHLIEGEINDWITRLKICIEHGEEKTFAPFDRSGHEKNMKEKTLHQLLKEFKTLREENLIVLRHLVKSEDILDLKGTHPAFGPVTVKELLATWAVHDLNHINQISKTLAQRYKDDVGPWVEYLGIYRN